MDRPDLDELFSAAYEELRRLAAKVQYGDAPSTLNPTALVNEAYLKLVGSLRMEPVSKVHFQRIAARAMRQVLIEAARRRQAAKRGGGAPLVTLDASQPAAPNTAEELLALNLALEKLASLNERQALVVECRFFGGLDLNDTARALDVSEATVTRDWRTARAWLASELGTDAAV